MNVLEPESNPSSCLSGFDLSNCPPELLRLLLHFLNENNELLRDNHELQAKILSLEAESQPLPESQEERKPVFSSRNLFLAWTLEHFNEIEMGATLIERNYPREGLENSRKTYVDFLFQDHTHQYLLVDVLFFDPGQRDDPMNYILSLNQACEHLTETMAVSSQKIRKLIVSHSQSHGIQDLCTLNQIEFLQVKGLYSLHR
jgi:hypothetical protein